jgi:hypothetical protein
MGLETIFEYGSLERTRSGQSGRVVRDQVEGANPILRKKLDTT